MFSYCKIFFAVAAGFSFKTKSRKLEYKFSVISIMLKSKYFFYHLFFEIANH